MKCTICDCEMENGYIPSYKGKLVWSPENQRHPAMVFSTPKGGFD